MVLYTAETASLAMLEVLAGLETDMLPLTYQLIQIDVPGEPEIVEFDDAMPTLQQSQDWGMAWLENGTSLLALVPSVIVPVERNMLINTEHPDSKTIRIIASSRHPWDHRLFR